VSVFSRLNPRLQHAIVARLGWTSLRQVQEQAGEALLDGRNAVVLAPTAGGKTEASMFPTLSLLVDEQPRGLGALYIAPIKALLNNQAERLGTYTEMVGLRRFVWHGDTPSSARKRFLADPTELLMTTPESLEVMLVSQRVDASLLFSEVRMVIIDEVHALAGTDRGAHLMSVLERIARYSRHDLQRVGLSATVGNPDAILDWLQGTSQRRGIVVDPPKDPARRQLLVVHRPEMAELARDASRMAKGHKSLFFCQSRSATEAVAEHMRWNGTTVFVHHSAVSKEERELAEERFHHGSDACIVCTSTLELGIDVGDLDRVLQAEAPDTVSSFLQRMGRTGRRAGQAANTTFFCETSTGVLQAIALIELARSGWVEEVPVSDRCWPVLVHQLFAMALADEGIPADEAWAHLSKLPDFRGIHRAEFDRLLAWMVRDRSLVRASGRLVLGPKAERRFGRRNFMDLYAVFSSPQTYTVLTVAGQPLGSLTQAFVDRLVEGTSCFLLGGRAWQVVYVRHDERQVRVDPAPRGKQPTWGGFLPQFLGFEVCQAIRRVLLAGPGFPYLHEGAADLLRTQRDLFSDVLDPAARDLEVEDDEIRWWTFAGGRINSTLRYALQAVRGDWKVVPDNLLLKVRGENLCERQLREAIDTIRELEFWENDGLWAEVAASLPNYRLSKFQPFVPPWVEREMVASYLLDVAGAWRWLSGESAASLARVPGTMGQPRPDEPTTPPPARSAPARSAEPRVRGRLPSRWVDEPEACVEACRKLAQESVVGLDVETTLHSRTLCIVQIAGAGEVYLFDALELADLEPIAELLANPAVTKVIHNADFERAVLGKHGMEIVNVVDTMLLSREKHGRDAEGGHSLKAVAWRELGIELDKTEQTSDWTRRPLNESQVSYAGLDAEVLLDIYPQLHNADPSDLTAPTPAERC
jgi:ATP-dependent Lhr-like helicase